MLFPFQLMILQSERLRVGVLIKNTFCVSSEHVSPAVKKKKTTTSGWCKVEDGCYTEGGGSPPAPSQKRVPLPEGGYVDIGVIVMPPL